jgi:hypothetical protein
MLTNKQHLAACKAAHNALWEGLDRNTHKGCELFFSRLTKTLASELIALAVGDVHKASVLLHKAVVPLTESELDYLKNDPELQGVTALLQLLKERRAAI